MQAMENTDVVRAHGNRIALVPSPTRAALPRPGSAGEGCGATRIVEKATRPTLLGLRAYIFSQTKAPRPAPPMPKTICSRARFTPLKSSGLLRSMLLFGEGLCSVLPSLPRPPGI